MQRTNISRDIKEDLELNRIYLPIKIRNFKGNIKDIMENKVFEKSIIKRFKKISFNNRLLLLKFMGRN